MKYSQIIGILASLALLGICFLPWVYIPSLNCYLTGLNGRASSELSFGIQIKTHGFFVAIMIPCFLIQKVWAKRTNFFIGVFNFAWAIKNYLIFSICRSGECPEKQPGIYFLVVVAALLFLMTLFPKIDLHSKE